MSDILQLGGNIELCGVSAIDPATLIVLKKLVGNYARQFSNKMPVEKLSITITKHDTGVSLVGILVTNNTSYTAEIQDKNLFLGLDAALKEIEKKMV
ncbi:hypothetical protein HY485_04210 [Candidatus Woesearchaeota archaeon]|nr:hypothetical protein [Candidatus Woesearchaeota archaeon]